MNKQRYRAMDFGVGVFIVLGVLAFLFMVIQVSGFSGFGSSKHYQISADFSDIGGLKIRAPVTVAGVKIGEVTAIELQAGTLNAKVTMMLRANKPIPFEDVSARILTEGLLGSNYISIVPGFDEDPTSKHAYLRAGDVIAKTQEAVILENLIGQLLFNIKK